MVTPNFDHYFSLGEESRKRNLPREIPAELKQMQHFGEAVSVSWLKGWDFRNAVLTGDRKEKDKPSSYP
jgi:hypothetical protein